MSASLIFPGSSNRWNFIGAAYPGASDASSRDPTLVRPQDRRGRPADVLLGSAPVADGDPHQRPAPPDRSREPAGAVALDARDHLAGPLVTLLRGRSRWLEAHQHLVEHHLVE